MPQAFLREAALICDAVLQAVLPTFGPTGSDQVVVSATQEVLLTNAAFTVLEYVDASLHPVGRLVVDAAMKFSEEFGDGTARFLLMVAAGLREATALPEGTPWPAVGAAVTALASGGAVQPEGVVASVGIDGSDAMWAQVSLLLSSHLHGNYSPASLAALVALAVAWMKAAVRVRRAHADEGFPDVLCGALCDLVDQFPVVLADRAPIAASKVWGDADHLVAGSLRRRHLLRSTSVSRAGFVVYTCALDDVDDESKSSVLLTSSDVFDTVVSFHALQAAKLVAIWAAAEVKVVVCTLAISEAIASACDQAGMFAVQFVEDEEAKRLCAGGGVSPVAERGLPGLSPHEVGLAEAVVVSPVGTKTFVNFVGVSTGDRAPPPPQLLVRAATGGLCRQYQQSIRRCLRVTQLWCSASQGRLPATAPATLPAGMRHWLVASHRIRAHTRAGLPPHSPSAATAAVRIADAMATSVPRALCQAMVEAVADRCGVLGRSGVDAASVVQAVQPRALRGRDGVVERLTTEAAGRGGGQHSPRPPPPPASRLTSAAWTKRYWAAHAAAGLPAGAGEAGVSTHVEPAGLTPRLWLAAGGLVAQLLRVERVLHVPRALGGGGVAEGRARKPAPSESGSDTDSDAVGST